MLLFGGKVAANQKRKLGAIESDVIGTVFVDQFKVGKKADVGSQTAEAAVACQRRQVSQTVEVAEIFFFFDQQPVVLTADFRWRVTEDEPGGAVHDQLVVLPD